MLCIISWMVGQCCKIQRKAQQSTFEYRGVCSNRYSDLPFPSSRSFEADWVRADDEGCSQEVMYPTSRARRETKGVLTFLNFFDEGHSNACFSGRSEDMMDPNDK